jgi:hypothetical protein
MTDGPILVCLVQKSAVFFFFFFFLLTTLSLSCSLWSRFRRATMALRRPSLTTTEVDHRRAVHPHRSRESPHCKEVRQKGRRDGSSLNGRARIRRLKALCSTRLLTSRREYVDGRPQTATLMTQVRKVREHWSPLLTSALASLARTASSVGHLCVAQVVPT